MPFVLAQVILRWADIRAARQRKVLLFVPSLSIHTRDGTRHFFSSFWHTDCQACLRHVETLVPANGGILRADGDSGRKRSHTTGQARARAGSDSGGEEEEEEEVSVTMDTDVAAVARTGGAGGTDSQRHAVGVTPLSEAFDLPPQPPGPTVDAESMHEASAAPPRACECCRLTRAVAAPRRPTQPRFPSPSRRSTRCFWDPMPPSRSRTFTGAARGRSLRRRQA